MKRSKLKGFARAIRITCSGLLRDFPRAYCWTCPEFIEGKPGFCLKNPENTWGFFRNRR